MQISYLIANIFKAYILFRGLIFIFLTFLKYKRISMSILAALEMCMELPCIQPTYVVLYYSLQDIS